MSRVETAAQLAMCTYMLETAVAWDKSIMKAVSIKIMMLSFIKKNFSVLHLRF